jgi:RNA polymerase sigma-70 factor (ECF subfamily)
MHDQSDLQLVEEVALGNSEALHVLYSRYGLELLNYLLSRMQDRQQAEDVLQSIMLAVWQTADSFRSDSSVRTWLYAIARRRMISAWRTSPPLDLPIHDADSLSAECPSTVLEVKMEGEMLAQAISHLPIDQQEALELFFFRDLSLAEAAAQTGININTFKSKLHRAKQNLRQIMREFKHV